MCDQCRHVVGHQLVAQGTIDIRGAPVGLQIDGDDLPVSGERRQDFAKHGGGSQAAMQHDQRQARPMDFVMEIQPVYGGIAAPQFSHDSYGSSPSWMSRMDRREIDTQREVFASSGASCGWYGLGFSPVLD